MLLHPQPGQMPNRPLGPIWLLLPKNPPPPNMPPELMVALLMVMVNYFVGWICPSSNAFLAALAFGVAISGASIFLYPVSLMAILGVPILLGMIGSIVIAIISRRENRATRAADLIPLVLGGLAVAIIMLGIMSGVRYLLFGPGPLELPL